MGAILWKRIVKDADNLKTMLTVNTIKYLEVLEIGEMLVI